MFFSDEVKELFAALSKAQGEFKPVPFDKTNPHFKNKYASLSATQESVRPILSKYELSVIQTIHSVDGRYELHTILAHSSGQMVISKVDLLLQRVDMQGLGSAITYAKRYALQSILGLAGDDDDDGNMASVQSSSKSATTKSASKNTTQPQYQKYKGEPKDFVSSLTKGKKLGELDHAQLAKIREWTTGQLKAKPRPKNIAQIADLHDNVKKMQSELPPADQMPDIDPQDFPPDDQLPPEAYADNPFDEFQDSSPKADSELPNFAPPSGDKKSKDDGPGAFILPALMEPRGYQNLHGKRLDALQPATLDGYMKALQAASVQVPKPSNVADMFGVIGKIKAYLGTL